MYGVTAAFCVLMFCLCISTINSSTITINLECDTNHHGKIVFRKDNGVQTAIADLHDVPGKQVNVILTYHHPPIISPLRKSPDKYRCDKWNMNRLLRKKNHTTIATLKVAEDGSVKRHQFYYEPFIMYYYGVILTTEDPKNRFDCCTIKEIYSSEIYDALKPRPSYAKCEFHGWIPGTGSSTHTLRKGGLHFRETPYNNRAERLVRMDFNELIPYNKKSKFQFTAITAELNKVKIEVYDNMSWNKPHCPNLAGLRHITNLGVLADSISVKQYNWSQFADLSLDELIGKGVVIIHSGDGYRSRLCCTVKSTDKTEFEKF